jgi:hypothetical protein
MSREFEPAFVFVLFAFAVLAEVELRFERSEIKSLMRFTPF